MKIKKRRYKICLIAVISIILIVAIVCLVVLISPRTKYEPAQTTTARFSKAGATVEFDADYYSFEQTQYFFDSDLNPRQRDRFIEQTNQLVEQLDFPYVFRFYVQQNAPSIYLTYDEVIAFYTSIDACGTVESVVNLLYPLYCNLPYGELYSIASLIARELGFDCPQRSERAIEYFQNYEGQLWDVTYLQFLEECSGSEFVNQLKALIYRFSVDHYGDVMVESCKELLNRSREAWLSEFTGYLRKERCDELFIGAPYCVRPYSINYPIELVTESMNYWISTSFQDSSEDFKSYGKFRYTIRLLEESYRRIREFVPKSYSRYNTNPTTFLLGEDEFKARYGKSLAGITKLNQNEMGAITLLVMEHEYVHYWTLKTKAGSFYGEFLCEGIAYYGSFLCGEIAKLQETVVYFDKEEVGVESLSRARAIYDKYLINHEFNIMDLLEVYALQDYLDSRENFTRQGVAFIHYLIKTYGEEQFWEFYETENCEAVYGESFEALKSIWQNYLTNKYLADNKK